LLIAQIWYSLSLISVHVLLIFGTVYQTTLSTLILTTYLKHA